MADTLNFLIAEEYRLNAIMKVIGVGGAGCNALDRMIRTGLIGVEFIAANTDAQALDRCLAPRKIQLGKLLTKGLGAGSDPKVGRAAAEADREIIAEALKGADLLFIAAGMGGGTGTGAAPVFAQIARETEALTIAIVTKPFIFEGRKRMTAAEGGIRELRDFVDTLVAIPNQALLSAVDNKTSLNDSFKIADSVLTQATKGISDIIAIPGKWNVDFADVRTIMCGGGDAIMGIGMAVGEGRGAKAARDAISCKLIDDVSIRGAQGVLVNITGSSELTLFDVNEAAMVIYEEAGDDANIIIGTVEDNNVGEEIRVTVIATGFNHHPTPPQARSAAASMLQPDRSYDFRAPRKVNLEEPAFKRRETATVGAERSPNVGNVHSTGNGGGKTNSGRVLHLGVIDLDGEPPDIKLPDFMTRKN
ncbi:MAG: cell division protein FtsZ [Calditrichota bacterium]